MRELLGWLFACLCWILGQGATFNQYDKQKLNTYREEVRQMFTHAYDNYLNHAYPYDELRPLSCDGVDTWGSYSLTLIDALDTLAVMGNYTEFSRVYHLVSERDNFDANINVSVFETNIRIVGGLLSAHLMAKRAGVPLEPGWPCSGPLLRLAEDAAERLLPAFDTATGLPYGTVNLRHGVPKGETPITCTAGAGTFIVEFGALSRLTGNPVYEKTALRALRALWHFRSGIGLLGNHIDVLTGRWTAVEAGIGAGVDSYYEYLVKGASLLARPELLAMFNQGREAIDQYLRKDDWHFWVNMKNGQVTLPLFQSLEAFWPGTLSMVGELESALKTLHNYHQVWKQYGFTPEFYNVAQGAASVNREGYPLRPELIESLMYLYRATGDPWLVDAGVDILKSIQYSAYTPCGYATIKNSKTHTLDNRMESFFLAETVKYLYLLFDTDNFIHNPGNSATIHETPNGRCVLYAGGYIFNTEAHPIDPAALACCHGMSETEVAAEISGNLVNILNPRQTQPLRGDLVPERLKELEKKRIQEALERSEKRRELLRMRLEEMRLKAAEEMALQQQQTEDLEKPEDMGEDVEDSEGVESRSVEVDSTAEATGRVEAGSGEAYCRVDAGSGDAAHRLEADSSDAPYRFEAGSAEAAGRVKAGSGEEKKTDEEPEFSKEKPASREDVDAARSTGTQEETTSLNGIVQPVSMPDILLKPTNVLVTAINTLLESWSPSNYPFDLEKYTQNITEDNSYPLNSSWFHHYALLSCPAQSFTDRFLIHGEFFGVG